MSAAQRMCCSSLVLGAPNRPLYSEVSGDIHSDVSSMVLVAPNLLTQTSKFLLFVTASRALSRLALRRHFQMTTTMMMTTRNAPSMEYDTTSCAVIEFEIVSLSPNGHMLILLLLVVDVNCIPQFTMC